MKIIPKTSRKMDFKEDSLIALLNRKAEALTFPKLLNELYRKNEPLKKRLTDKLTEYERFLSGDKSVSEQSARKVRYWLAGYTLPGSREELFKICFALGFNLDQTEKLFCSTAESGIHFRNPREIVYAFCLKFNKDYPEALKLSEKLLTPQEGLPQKTTDYQNRIRSSSNTEPCKVFTVSIRNDFKYLKTEEDLSRFLERNSPSLGFHHNTAYSKFCLMLNYLMECTTDSSPADLPLEKRYSIQRTAEEYLRMGIPYEKKNASYDKLQKLIKKYWPSPRSVQEMFCRKRDVSRKTLLILYLATEGMGIELSEEDFLEEHSQRINLMLSDSGMALLNIHNPFDYLILQCLYLEGEDDFMSRRMERFLSKIFKNPEHTAYIRIKTNKARCSYEPKDSST